MKIVVLVVGRLKEDYLRAAEAEYLKRLRPYARVEVVEVKDEAALVAAIPDRALLCVFDERGESQDSPTFARRFLADEGVRGGGRPVVFAIGGADGHGEAVRKRADAVLSFGKLTIAHRLVRVLVLEQIYRGFRIVSGEPYHR